MKASPNIAQELASGYSRSFRRVEYLSIVIFLALIINNSFLLLQFFSARPWTLVLGFFSGWFLADFISGLVHWGADTWGTAEFPILGPTLIRSFREHHVDPLAITRHDFVETNGASCLVCIPILSGVRLLLHFGASSSWFLLFLGMVLNSLCLWTLMTNQAHKWAHQGEQASAAIKRLQSLWLLLPSRAHAEHHRAPFDQSYCITTGWMNPVVNRIELFRKLERLITQLTGAEPRDEDLKNLNKVGSVEKPVKRAYEERV